MTTAQMSVYFFLQAAVILIVCRLVGWLAQRIGQPQVVGEMIAGVLLGPSLFGLVAPDIQQALFPRASLDVLYVAAQFGVGLYMFLVGSEFRSDQFRTRYGSAMLVSIAGIVVPFVLGFALTPWLVNVPGLFSEKANRGDAALFLGAAIAITAFPMLARIIYERGLTGTPLGTLALSAGAVGDAFAWCILAVVLASFEGSWGNAWRAIGGGIAFAIVILTFGRAALQRLKYCVDAEKPLSNTMLAILLALFSLCGWAMDSIGIHAVFGGFLLGVSLPKGPLTEKVRESLQPFVVVFLLPMFFTYSGLKTQLNMLVEPHILLAAAVILVSSFAGKGIACWAAARLSGQDARDSMAIGALMNARGLMELILINIGLQAGVIESGLFSVLVLMAIVTTLAATPLFNWIMRARTVSQLASEGRTYGR
jgi:Kef-type K+ transport system membrane component KefB